MSGYDVRSECDVAMETIVNFLKENVAEVVFTKVDGTSRTMKCTLKSEFLPPQMDIEEYTPRKNAVAVWDLEKDSWRSFRVDSMTSMKAV